MRKQNDIKPEMLFEVSWEVCNRVGGIYAVLSTKAKTLHDKYKDNLIFIGPDFWSPENESPFFKEAKTPLLDWQNNANLPQEMSVRVGRWNVPGKPIAVLVKFQGLQSYKNELYAQMWEHFGVDSLHAYGDYDDSCLFGFASALVIESIMNWKGDDAKAIAHFDEWTTGMGLLHVKLHAPKVATVFTTHATSIGRSICGHGQPLYDYMAGYNGNQMADELNMQSKHSLERTAAHASDAFTTVSAVTGRECEQLLEIKPFITPNAFEQNFVPKEDDYEQARCVARKKLIDVASALTGEKFSDSTLLFVTSGRSEFRNKGLDVTLDAINVVRNEVRNVKRKAILFVMVPGWVDVPRTDLKENLENGKPNRLPNPVITHTLHDYNCDAILNHINYLGIANDENDNVKVVYVPSYLNGDDGIFNLSYYGLLAGFDGAIFASYYEPWGYTPLESAAFAVPTITTDLAGFGQWVLDNYGDDTKKTGIKVLHRTDSNYGETVASLAESVVNLIKSTAPRREALRQKAQEVAKAASWKNFMKYYYEAYEHALEKASKR